MGARDVAALGDGEAEVEVEAGNPKAERARLQPQAAAAAAADERRRPPERPAAAKAEPCECDEASVRVPCHLLREVIAESCCPLHLRLELAHVLSAGASGTLAAGLGKEAASPAAALPASEAASRCAAELQEEPQHPALTWEDAGAALPAPCCGGAGLSLLAGLNERCLMAVTSFLPFATVLEVRACGREPLQWAMHTGASEEAGPRHWVHDRVRVRLWMRRIEDLTAGTPDESVFETRMRSLVDEALRSRMGSEMQEALANMQEQIRAFQAEVDQRIEEQEQYVRRLVEERVQQELDAILASEVVKMEAMVEERVREQVSAMFRREVRETVRELQSKLDSIIEENEVLEDAFAEANLRSKLFFWATHPPAWQVAAASGAGLDPRRFLSLGRRVAAASAGPVISRPSSGRR